MGGQFTPSLPLSHRLDGQRPFCISRVRLSRNPWPLQHATTYLDFQQ